MRAIASGLPLRTPKSQRPVEVQPAEVSSAPRLRLRFLLLAGVAYGIYSLAFPRLSAAWKLHSQATALADYGACMAGPTGPGLLRDHQLGPFERLLRRRLIAVPPTDHPFERCAPLARTLTGSAEVEGAHRAAAGSFAEYGASDRPERSLATLAVSSGGLAELARAAWPFARGYALLVKPSLGAKEAPHPVAPPAAAAGRGLPSGRPLYRATRVERHERLSRIGSRREQRIPAQHRRRLDISCGIECSRRGHGRSLPHGNGWPGVRARSELGRRLDHRVARAGRGTEADAARSIERRSDRPRVRRVRARCGAATGRTPRNRVAAVPVRRSVCGDAGSLVRWSWWERRVSAGCRPRPGNDHPRHGDGERRAGRVVARWRCELDAVFGRVRRWRRCATGRSATDRTPRARAARAALRTPWTGR